MANGYQGTKEGWQRIAEPLERLDKKLEKFASDKGLPFAVNTKNWPNREYRWLYKIDRLIEIFLESEESLTYTLWICAYDYENSARLRKRETIFKAAAIDELDSKLEDLLEEAYDKVCSWTTSDLSLVDV